MNVQKVNRFNLTEYQKDLLKFIRQSDKFNKMKYKAVRDAANVYERYKSIKQADKIIEEMKNPEHLIDL